MVRSGGMYNTKWPGTTVGTNSGLKAPKYDGTLAYAYAKRGQVRSSRSKQTAGRAPPDSLATGPLRPKLLSCAQVLVAERLSAQYAEIKFATCHPGWTDTPGVEEAFGRSKRYLQPLRTLWQVRQKPTHM